MVRIIIKFRPTMEILVGRGVKRATTRTEPKGDVGDTFLVRGREYRLLDVRPMLLGDIRDQFYEMEGFISPGQFQRIWILIYDNFPEGDVCYLHIFEECS